MPRRRLQRFDKIRYPIHEFPLLDQSCLRHHPEHPTPNLCTREIKNKHNLIKTLSIYANQTYGPRTTFALTKIPFNWIRTEPALGGTRTLREKIIYGN